MKAERKLKIVLELDEQEACEVYISLKPPYVMDAPERTKEEIERCLGYIPKEAP